MRHFSNNMHEKPDTEGGSKKIKKFRTKNRRYYVFRQYIGNFGDMDTKIKFFVQK